MALNDEHNMMLHNHLLAFYPLFVSYHPNSQLIWERGKRMNADDRKCTISFKASSFSAIIPCAIPLQSTQL